MLTAPSLLIWRRSFGYFLTRLEGSFTSFLMLTVLSPHQCPFFFLSPRLFFFFFG